MTTSRLRPLLCVAALSLGAAGAGPATSSAASCKSGGLGYEYVDGGATFSIKVSKVRATNGASCRVARKIARTTALAVLFGGSVPKKPEGYRLDLDEPCGGCAPRFEGTATKGARKVTFVLNGGA